MDIIYNICLILVIIGFLNWWLISLFKFDLVVALFAGNGSFGKISGLSRIIYGLVGLSAIYIWFKYFFMM